MSKSRRDNKVDQEGNKKNEEQHGERDGEYRHPHRSKAQRVSEQSQSLKEHSLREGHYCHDEFHLALDRKDNCVEAFPGSEESIRCRDSPK